MLATILMHIFTIGTASSIVVAFLLVVAIYRFKNKSYRYFQILLTALALSILSNTLLATFTINHYSGENLSEPFQLLIGPFLYFYLVYLVQGCLSSIQVRLHFIPFIVVAFILFFYLANFWIDKPLGDYNSLAVRGLAFLVYIQLWVYFYLCQRELARYREKLKRSCSDIDRLSEAWVSRALMGLLLCYSVLTVVYLLNHGAMGIPVNRALSGIQALFAFYISYNILRWSLLSSSLSSLAPVMNSTGQARYEKSGLSKEAASEIETRLLALMSGQRPYLNSDLTIAVLAAQLNVSVHHLSQVMNSRDGEAEGKNFYDFINSYRVNAVKAMFNNAEYNQQTILDIAFEAGFTSKATFNRVFKKHTNSTPLAYRELKKRQN